ncbi:MAG: HAD-IIIA family hydrolase [Synergistaceae bacterium]|nr:HAD-IIIA family hydrolase [Synergistaceae bacterium]
MIRFVAMDVDGTLTDGGLYMNGDAEFKKFNARDGYGIKEMIKRGIEVAFISGRYSEATDVRAKELGVATVFNGTKEKLRDLQSSTDELGLSRDEVAFIGDDIPDIPCLQWAGLGIAVCDATDEVKSASDMVLNARGGEGAVREAIEYIIRLNENAENK